MENLSRTPFHLKRLRFLAVLIPTLALVIYELARWRYVPRQDPLWLDFVLSIVLILVGSSAFSFWVFHVVEEMDAQTRRQAARAQALLEIAQAINSSLKVKTILQQAVDLSRQHIGAAYGEMHFLRGERGIEDHGVRFSGLKPGSCPVNVCPTLTGLNGEVLRTGKPIRLADRREHPISVGDLPDGHPPIGAFLGVPVLVRGEAEADLLLIRSPEDAPFTQDDENFLQTVAHQTALAIENAKLYEDVYHLAALEERERLAYEMHDGFAQTLGYLNLRLNAVTEQLTRQRAKQAVETLTEARQVVKSTYEEVRRTIFDLRSGPDENLEFIPALEKYLYEFGLQANIVAKLVLAQGALPSFSPGEEVQLIRIIQEALANVRRHAQASNVAVQMERHGQICSISIEDDGIGFDHIPQRADGRPHFGIQTMRERAESVGGSLTIEPHQPRGTRVTVQIKPNAHHERRIT